MAPEQIGAFRVVGLLGEGGMGLVYDAIDTRLGRQVALKTIRQDAVDHSLARDRFWREARLAATVNHPNICQIYEVGEVDGMRFLAMERLEGQSLAVRLASGPLPFADVVSIGLEVLSGLEALHARGIVHRDMKPGNVFLTRHGVKLLDFGLARAANDVAETQASLTLPGAVVGTPKYMAPEQVQGGPVDARTDLFATGAILYEMLTGRTPFDAASLVALADKILRADPPMLAGSPQIAAVDRVIHRALAKAPTARYGTAAAMAADLRTVPVAVEPEPRPARPVTRLIVLPFRWLRSDDEFAFLTFSLADAITNSLSSLESIVIRSPLVAARFAADVPDLSVIAREADVDVVLSGTILRAGDRLRVGAELVDTPSGTLRWSHSSQVQVGDIFQLQDDLSRRIIESLSLPLSARERSTLARDAPSSARAYEFYLRGNQLSVELATVQVARDLYLECVREDPHYAPAWGQLGRAYRVIAKYYGESDQASMAMAESAFNRALALNPELATAHRFYAEMEVDTGRALDAMVRLLRRASSRSTAPEIFAALVTPCRYCGLLQASVGAHELARRLDPHVRTSAMHTWIAAGDYSRAIEEAGPGSSGDAWVAMAMAGHHDAARQLRQASAALRVANATWLAQWLDALGDRIEGRGSPDALCSATEALERSTDLDGRFYAVASLARFGGEQGADRAVQNLAKLVSGGFFPYETLMKHPWLDGLRHRPDFLSTLEQANDRHSEAQAAFMKAGGEALLGAAQRRPS
jgi:eukaryotic-like serine/threonine-protein kinase